MKKPNQERLIKLGRIMRSVKPENVNMGCIADDVCGSVGCALGHMAMNKDFKKELRLKLTDKYGNIGITYKNTFYQPYQYDVLGSKIFGISEQEADYLFCQSYETSISDKEVFLKRYRAFMKKHNLKMN